MPRGGSNYGPFTAAVLVRAGKGPLAIDIQQLLVAGITVHGAIVQTAAGPFAGTLCDRRLGPRRARSQLAAAGKNQAADVDLTANGAQAARRDADHDRLGPRPARRW